MLARAERRCTVGDGWIDSAGLIAVCTTFSTHLRSAKACPPKAGDHGIGCASHNPDETQRPSWQNTPSSRWSLSVNFFVL